MDDGYFTSFYLSVVDVNVDVLSWCGSCSFDYLVPIFDVSMDYSTWQFKCM